MIRCEIGSIRPGVPFALVHDKVTGDTLLVYDPMVEPEPRSMLINALLSMVDDRAGRRARLRVVVNDE